MRSKILITACFLTVAGTLILLSCARERPLDLEAVMARPQELERILSAPWLVFLAFESAEGGPVGILGEVRLLGRFLGDPHSWDYGPSACLASGRE